MSIFVSFEGGEGVGKSTQLSLCAAKLRELGYNVVTTREPFSTELARDLAGYAIKNIEKIDTLAEYILYLIGRVDHIQKVIKPALESNSVVLCDRYFDSSIVYQCYGQGLDEALVRDLHDRVCNGFMPSLTMVLDLPIEIARKRIESRAQKSDVYDQKSNTFFNRIRQGMLKVAELDKNRCVVVDGALEIQEISNIIMRNILNFLEESKPIANGG